MCSYMQGKLTVHIYTIVAQMPWDIILVRLSHGRGIGQVQRVPRGGGSGFEQQLDRGTTRMKPIQRTV